MLCCVSSAEKGNAEEKGIATEGSSESSDEFLAVRITQEVWSPVSGRNKFTQRLFRVEFSDGSTQDLVAEDLVDSLPGNPSSRMNFMRKFYKSGALNTLLPQIGPGRHIKLSL